MRLFVKTTWDIERRDGSFILTETTKGRGHAASSTVEFPPFETHAKAFAFAECRQEGIAEMMARMRAQMTLAMRGEKAA